MNRQQGMTLIELMIVLAIFGILITVAAPSFQDTTKRNRVESQLRELGTQMKFARSEAVTVQRTITVCHLDSAAPAACDTNWSDGLTMFFDDNANSQVDAGETTLRVINQINPNVLTVVSAGGVAQNAIQFTPRGRSDVRATIKICDSGSNTRYARALLLELTGMAILSRINSATNVYRDINNNDLTCP